MRSYGRARACISLANTHPTQHRRLRRSSPRSKQRQSAKGTPARAYEHHQHEASAFVQEPSTTSPLVCPHRLTVPPRPKRAPLQRTCAHAACCSTQCASGSQTTHFARSCVHLHLQKGNASVREMYLNIDAVAMHEPGTVDCALAAAAVLGFNRALLRLAHSLAVAVTGECMPQRKESAACRATAPLCFQLKRCTAAMGPCHDANHTAR